MSMKLRSVALPAVTVARADSETARQLEDSSSSSSCMAQRPKKRLSSSQSPPDWATWSQSALFRIHGAAQATRRAAHHDINGIAVLQVGAVDQLLMRVQAHAVQQQAHVMRRVAQILMHNLATGSNTDKQLERARQTDSKQ